MDQAAAKHLQAWRITIENGPHAGVSVPIGLAQTSFGKAIDNDIVAADERLTDREAVFLLERGQLTLQPLGAAWTVNGSGVVVGKTLRLRHGAAITAGDTRLRVSRAEKPAYFRSKAFALCTGGVAVAIGALAALTGFGTTKFAAAAPLRAASYQVRPPSAGSTAMLRAELSNKIKSASLSGVIDLRQKGAAIFASGIVPAVSLPRWRHLAKWFDNTAQGKTMLIDQVKAASAIAAPVAVAAVSFGRTPFVASRSGHRYTLGAAIPGGWILSHVAAHHILLDKDGKTLRVNF